MHLFRAIILASTFFPAFQAFAGTSIIPLGGAGFTCPGMYAAGKHVDTGSALGLTAGISARYDLTEKISVEGGGFFSQREHDYWVDQIGTHQKFHQVIVPAQIKFHTSPYTSIGVGGYGALGVGSVYSQTQGSTKNASYSEASLDRFDYGMIASMTLDVPIAESLFFVAEGQYLYGLNNLSQASQGKLKFRDIRALLGARILL